ncbi:MAG: carboxypeptidase regulatory-like domain-containing protein, partial [Candidatus Cloacimonetes bacterium]|nr:carboxypeptidase regulatory-like domain-containing protein [Candidatus Cloacimonadota bacterium]
MKRLIIILAMGLIIGLSFAGIDEYYTFNAISGTYTPIVGTNANISSDEAISEAIPIGFTFPYGDYIYNEVKISSNGWIGLGTFQTNTIPSNNLAATNYVPFVAPLWDDCSLAAGSCEYLLSGTAPNRIFTIQYNNLKWRYNSTTLFNLQARLYENGKIDFVYGSSTGDPNTPSASIGINMLPGGSGWFYSITPGTPATASTTTANNAVNVWPGEGTIYEFNPVVPVPNDLAALSITGHTYPTAGQSYDYVITVRNRGSNPQTTYQIKLLLGTQEIGLVNGTTIQAGEILTFTIPWIPSTAGPATLYGKVVLTGDENSNNDQTPPLNIAVQPAGVQAVTIGAGDQLARVPMDFFYKNSLFECLYYSDELGFANGTITSLLFYNNFLSNLPNKPTKIWLGTTNQADLSAGWIPSTELTLVFDGNITYPSGANTITIPLLNPYTHTAGNLVMMVQRPMDTQYYTSSDNFLAQTIGTNRARKVQSDIDVYNPANPPTTGTALGQFPKTTFLYIGQATVNDLSCLNISGNPLPTVGNNYNYLITIRNNGSATQDNYTVKLMMEGGQELNSVQGPTISPSQTLEVLIPWTPTTPGPTYLYGEVFLTDDEIVFNNQSSHLNIEVLPAGMQGVTIGEGNQNARVPMDFYYKNSLFECLYYQNELGFISGTITSLAFYNNFADSPANGATKIWLGTTNQADLSAGWIPSTELTLVFDGIVSYPSGINTIIIPLQTPYFHTPGNLVMMVQRPMDTQYYSSSDYFLAQTMGANRSRRAYADSVTYDPANPPGVTPSEEFPKTTIFYLGQELINDLSCLSISGPSSASVGSVSNYTIRVRNNGTATQNNYTVKLMQEGGVQLSAVPGIPINSLQTLDFTINWTPTETGATYIYGEVEMTGDEIATNNQSSHLNVLVYPQGTIGITIGTGTSTGRMPMDFYWKNSLFETIYHALELNIGGLLTDIQLYSNFVSNLSNMPTNIWVGETTQADLSAGWIPSTQLTLVFSGNVDYPSGPNDIIIHLTTPYPYGGGNLVVMVERPMDTQYYNINDVFRTQTGTVSNRTRNIYSDSIDYDPANPPTATPTAMFPMTTLMFITSGLGAITGTVYGPGDVPFAGATVVVEGTNLSYTTGADGTFTFPYVAQGEHQVTASKHGYYDVTNTVTVIEDQTVTTNFTLTPLPQVTVTGR